MMFSNFKLSNLRNSEFVQFFQDLLNILLSNNPTELLIEDPYKQLKQLNDSLTAIFKQKQGSPLTEKLALLDSKRDNLLSGLSMLVDGYTYSYEEAVKQAALTLRDSLSFYGNITRLNYSSETSTISDLIGRLQTEAKLSAALKTLNLEDWVAKLDELNKEFSELFILRVKEDADTPEIKIKDLRVEVVEKYNLLLDYIKAYSIVKSPESYTPLIKQINSLVEQYDRILTTRQAKAASGDETVEQTEETKEA